MYIALRDEHICTSFRMNRKEVVHVEFVHIQHSLSSTSRISLTKKFYTQNFLLIHLESSCACSDKLCMCRKVVHVQKSRACAVFWKKIWILKEVVHVPQSLMWMVKLCMFRKVSYEREHIPHFFYEVVRILQSLIWMNQLWMFHKVLYKSVHIPQVFYEVVYILQSLTWMSQSWMSHKASYE